MHKSSLRSWVRVCVWAGGLALLSPLVSYAQYSISDEDAIAAAKKFAKLIVNGNYDKAAKLFADDAEKETSNEFKDMFAKSGKDLGKFKSFGEASVEAFGDRKLVTLPATFEHGFLNLNILVNYQEKVMWIKYQSLSLPGKVKIAGSEQPVETEVKDVTFGKDPWKVKGKLTMPKTEGDVPAVVLVHGSGPHDEDEKIGPNKPFEDLANGLGQQGVAVLRYPNRTFAYKDKLEKKKAVTVREETVEDVLEALKFLRKEKGIDKSQVYVMGLGFGGTVAPQIAQEDKKVAGVILLASQARPVADSLEGRLKYQSSLPGPDQAGAKKMLEASQEMINKLRDGSAPDDGELLGQSIKRWKDLNEYSVKSAEVLAELDCRVLIAGAGRDFQVTRADFDAYKKALKDKPNAKFKWYKPMNHFFMRGEGKSSLQEYEKEAPFDPVVIGQLGKWIKAGESSSED